MGKMFVPDGTGHTEAAIWDVTNPASCVIASQAFEKYQREGYAAFELTESGETVGVMDRFNPESEEITFLRPFAGG